jgi:hypothetical protein
MTCVATNIVVIYGNPCFNTEFTRTLHLFLSYSLVLIFLAVPFPLASPPITDRLSSSPHSCYIPDQSHPPQLDISDFEVEVTLRLTFSHSVCLGIEHPCGTFDQILLPVGMLVSEICGLVSVGHPLWREDRSAIYSAITHGNSRAEPVTILYRLIWDSPNLENQVPVFISHRNKVAQLYALVLVMQLSPNSCHIIPLRCKYPTHHPVLKPPVSVFFPSYQRPS